MFLDGRPSADPSASCAVRSVPSRRGQGNVAPDMASVLARFRLPDQPHVAAALFPCRVSPVSVDVLLALLVEQEQPDDATPGIGVERLVGDVTAVQKTAISACL